MLAIRFNRTGKRNHASFRVVLQEHTKAPGKRHVEILGSYDPHKKATILNKDRILYWIGQGAQTSPVVTNLLIREGIIERKKIAKKMPRPVVKEPAAALAVADKPVVEAKAEEAAAPVVEEGVKVEETPASVAPETKTEEASVSAEGVKIEEVSAEALVEEVKVSETAPAEANAEMVAETAVEAKEEVPVVESVPAAEVSAEPKA
ncbi:MAG: 30S ribosomal protein S16 [Candidatus Moranbacteria bacterium]|nr:30S ribosomal protein S16 [Candidatus Moranbacteria bacterium]